MSTFGTGQKMTNNLLVEKIEFYHNLLVVIVLHHFQEITVFPEKTGTVHSILQEAHREFHFAENGTKVLRLVYWLFERICKILRPNLVSNLLFLFRLVHVGVVSHCLRVYQVFPNDMPASDVFTKIGSATYGVGVDFQNITEVWSLLLYCVSILV